MKLTTKELKKIIKEELYEVVTGDHKHLALKKRVDENIHMIISGIALNVGERMSKVINDSHGGYLDKWGDGKQSGLDQLEADKPYAKQFFLAYAPEVANKLGLYQDSGNDLDAQDAVEDAVRNHPKWLEYDRIDKMFDFTMSVIRDFDPDNVKMHRYAAGGGNSFLQALSLYESMGGMFI